MLAAKCAQVICSTVTLTYQVWHVSTESCKSTDKTEDIKLLGMLKGICNPYLPVVWAWHWSWAQLNGSVHAGYHQDKIPLCNAEFIRGYFEAQVRMNEQVARGRV